MFVWCSAIKRVNNWAAIRKGVFWHMGTVKAQISLRACAQADQGLHCPLTELLDTTECLNWEQRPEWYFKHAQDDLICAFYTCSKVYFRLVRPDFRCVVGKWPLSNMRTAKARQLLHLRILMWLYLFTHLCRVDSSTTALWTGLFPMAGCLVNIHFYHILQKFLYLMQTVENSIRPPRSAASDLGLHCLPLSILLHAKQKWVNVFYNAILAATWENVPSDMCAQRRLKSACASAQTDQSLRCPQEECLHPGLLKIWIFPGRICPKVCFWRCYSNDPGSGRGRTGQTTRKERLIFSLLSYTWNGPVSHDNPLFINC